jgi:hypothetical protein
MPPTRGRSSCACRDEHRPAAPGCPRGAPPQETVPRIQVRRRPSRSSTSPAREDPREEHAPLAAAHVEDVHLRERLRPRGRAPPRRRRGPRGRAPRSRGGAECVRAARPRGPWRERTVRTPAADSPPGRRARAAYSSPRGARSARPLRNASSAAPRERAGACSCRSRSRPAAPSRCRAEERARRRSGQPDVLDSPPRSGR